MVGACEMGLLFYNGYCHFNFFRQATTIYLFPILERE
jgi:hypothetical protein